MRLLHTSDWHLGQDFYRHERRFEHKAFLDWLLNTLRDNAIDALMVSGDVFDSSNPPASAQRMLYEFIRDAQAQCPGLRTIITAGNHDSPARLEAPAQLLKEFGVSVVGRVSFEGGVCTSREPFLLPLHVRGSDSVAAVCVALPFLRSADLQAEHLGCSYAEAVLRVYENAIQQARRQYGADLPLVVMGHLHASGGQTSEHSERRLVIGGEEAVALAKLSDQFSYAALGHLHLAQIVSKCEHVRYSGSPLPLSFSEINYPHQVLQVDIGGRGQATVTQIPVPRSVELLRVPARAQPLSEVLEELAKISCPVRPFEERPYLEVPVLRDQPMPDLRAKLEEALKNTPVRLTRIVYTKAHEASESAPRGLAISGLESLKSIHPVTVLERLHEKKFSQPVSEQLKRTFSEAMRDVNSGVEL